MHTSKQPTVMRISSMHFERPLTSGEVGQSFVKRNYDVTIKMCTLDTDPELSHSLFVCLISSSNVLKSNRGRNFVKFMHDMHLKHHLINSKINYLQVYIIQRTLTKFQMMSCRGRSSFPSTASICRSAKLKTFFSLEFTARLLVNSTSLKQI